MAGFTILHTSDWHLGHQLCRRRRDDEFEAFLNWLSGQIADEKVDHVIIAGDVFDTGAPGVGAQRMYYDFLVKAAKAGARNIIITAGNHDSPAFLTAAGQLLKSLNIHVVGSAADNIEEEIVVLNDATGAPEAIVCAVPYLRERDARKFQPGQSIEDKERELAQGISAHYQKIADAAARMRAETGREIPVIATGHLFAAGAAAGDGVRELYVGALGRLPHTIFPDIFDYVALGHIHRPQKIGNMESRRYSGSPLPMSFGEAGQEKCAILVRFDGREPLTSVLPVPAFRKFVSIRGSRDAILARLAILAATANPDSEEAWLEIEHDGSDAPGDLNRAAHELVSGLPLEILCVKARRQTGGGAARTPGRRLEELTPEDMFRQRLAQAGYAPEQNESLLGAFRELLALWHESEGGN